MNRKQAIMETATRLFAEKGFYNTSTVEIAESAGVAHGTIFYHYKNKEGIMLEIFQHAGDIYLEEMAAAAESRKSGMEKIEAILRFNTAFRHTHSRQLLIFLRDFPEKLNSQESELKTMVEATSERVLELISCCLEAGIADGSIAPVDTRKTAFIINGLTFGLLHMDLLSPVQVPELEEDVNQFCRAALLRGRPRPNHNKE